ncbi:MAG: N-acetylmuramoyl-L-alanine amidase, partial [Bdellovibrionales bacterium]
LILHYTGIKTAKDALDHLCDEKSKGSAHYVIEENGKIHQLVNDNMRAWHAGVSYWQGETDINSSSIGIEIVNTGPDFGYKEFPGKQIKKLIKLCKDLMDKHEILASHVLGHSDIAVTRKIDPGHLFPWEKLAKEGVGLWPEVREHDYQGAQDIILNPESLNELLCAFGYDPSKPFDELVIAFHRHFVPEKFQDATDKPSEADVGSVAKLLALIRQMHENGSDIQLPTINRWGQFN